MSGNNEKVSEKLHIVRKKAKRKEYRREK